MIICLIVLIILVCILILLSLFINKTNKMYGSNKSSLITTNKLNYNLDLITAYIIFNYEETHKYPERYDNHISGKVVKYMETKLKQYKISDIYILSNYFKSNIHNNLLKYITKKNKKKQENYTYNLFSCLLIITSWFEVLMKFSNVHLNEYIGSGLNNIVFTISYNNKTKILRIFKNVKKYNSEHYHDIISKYFNKILEKFSDNRYIKVLNKTLKLQYTPYVFSSSIDYKRIKTNYKQFDINNKFITPFWTIYEKCNEIKDLNHEKSILVCNDMINACEEILKNDLYYYDWKIDNIMESTEKKIGNRYAYVIIDTDFETIDFLTHTHTYNILHDLEDRKIKKTEKEITIFMLIPFIYDVMKNNLKKPSYTKHSEYFKIDINDKFTIKYLKKYLNSFK